MKIASNGSMDRTATANRLHNEYRREARERWALASPFRQKLYIEARIKGASPEEAIKRSRGNLRPEKLAAKSRHSPPSK